MTNPVYFLRAIAYNPFREVSGMNGNWHRYSMECDSVFLNPEEDDEELYSLDVKKSLVIDQCKFVLSRIISLPKNEISDFLGYHFDMKIYDTESRHLQNIYFTFYSKVIERIKVSIENDEKLYSHYKEAVDEYSHWLKDKSKEHGLKELENILDTNIIYVQDFNPFAMIIEKDDRIFIKDKKALEDHFEKLTLFNEKTSRQILTSDELTIFLGSNFACYKPKKERRTFDLAGKCTQKELFKIFYVYYTEVEKDNKMKQQFVSLIVRNFTNEGIPLEESYVNKNIANKE
jgi:hypothetical protein